MGKFAFLEKGAWLQIIFYDDQQAFSASPCPAKRVVRFILFLGVDEGCTFYENERY